MDDAMVDAGTSGVEATSAADSSSAPTDPVEARRAFSAALDDGPARAGARSAEESPDTARGQGDDGATRAMAERIAQERYGAIADAYSGLDADTAEALTYLAGLYATDPERAAYELATAFGVDMEDPDDAMPTRAEMRAAIEEGWREFEMQAQLAQVVETGRTEIRSTAHGLGYELGSDAYFELLTVARDRYAHMTAAEAVRAAARDLDKAQARPAKVEPREGESPLNAAARAFRAAL